MYTNPDLTQNYTTELIKPTEHALKASLPGDNVLAYLVLGIKQCAAERDQYGQYFYTDQCIEKQYIDALFGRKVLHLILHPSTIDLAVTRVPLNDTYRQINIYGNFDTNPQDAYQCLYYIYSEANVESKTNTTNAIRNNVFTCDTSMIDFSALYYDDIIRVNLVQTAWAQIGVSSTFGSIPVTEYSIQYKGGLVRSVRSNDDSLSTGAKVGIAIGVSLAFVIFITIAIVSCHRRRRASAHLKSMNRV
jgi:hypothetical protein